MLTGMQAYSVAFSVAVLWLLSSLGSLRPGVIMVLGVAILAGSLLVTWIGNSDEEGESEASGARRE